MDYSKFDYNVRGDSIKGYSLFFYKGSGKTLKSSFLYKKGDIFLFKKVLNASVAGDKIKQKGLPVDKGFSFSPEFK